MIVMNYHIESDYMEITLKGHADYHPGCDIVCAGCSAIFYSLIGALENSNNDFETIDIIKDSGHGSVKVTGGNEKVCAYYTMAIIGIMQIEKSYEKYVCVEKV